MLWRGKQGTFKPPKKAAPGSRRFDLHGVAATLHAGDMSQAVKLPPGEDLLDWLTVNATDFYNEISLLWDLLAEDTCTALSCPTMSAGRKYEYKWADGAKVKKPLRCSAPKYMDYMMRWVQGTLDDETLFPVRVGEPFPPNARDTLSTIFKRLFRVYAHIYTCHFEKMKELGAEAHLNTCFRHFVTFVQEFNLIDAQELAPLDGVITRLVHMRVEPAASVGASGRLQSSCAAAGPAVCLACGATSSGQLAV